ncbi:MAG: error-prone DNA polymerase [Dehalococcoidia bacterium]|nr:MAG: error-prone DNA polymerase [Dehalococcoidia bacterium]
MFYTPRIVAGYVELHAHSCWSLREGASTTDELIDRALALGYPAMALTDHDNLYGAMEYAQAARERGLKPITGCELTVGGGRREEGEGSAPPLPRSGALATRDSPLATPSHLTVLAQDVEGYRNLCRLLSRAYRVHGKDAPVVEREWLFEHHAGLVVLSGCRDSELARLAVAEPRRAAELAGEYREVFGDRYYVELQHHDVFGDTERVAALAAVAERCGIEVVVTNNVHYHVRTRHRLNDVLVAVRHRLTLDSSHRERRPNSEFFLKSAEEMAHRFERYPRAVSNTLAIAERCAFDLTRDLPYELPDYPVPDGATLDSFLRGVCERAFRRKYPPTDPFGEEARERLERELSLIAKHRLAGFFLVYWDLLQLVNEIAVEVRGRDARLQPDERPVGRGRGSSVSSIVCYLIGLSHIDPVRNNLYLERFLNDELHSLPDIDLDFPRDIRDEVLRRIYDRYGEEHAAIVAAFPTYRFRSAVLDIGKALGLPAPVLAKLNKLGGPYSSATAIAEEMRKVPELRPLVDAPIWRDMVELAGQVAGFPRHIGQHVGGVIVSSEPLSSVVPVEPARMDGRFVCQWDKDSADDARFVKIDFLALGMLSAVDECLEIIEEEHGVRVDLGRVPHDSPEIYASIREGDTMGVFQIESRAQVQTLPRTQPNNLDDLAVQVAIIRPGPIMAGAFRPYMEYRERLARGEAIEVDYGHPELGPLLEHCLGETLGHVLYQDQVLQISCAVAGFTPGQADRLRRAMSRKRSSDAMQALAAEFYAGAGRMGVSREAAKVAFDKMAAFAAFGFPKSHAVAFALLAYESAWLRYHYPAAYYCSLFNAQPMGFYSVEVLTQDAARHGIATLPPSINASRAGAWPEQGDIRLGLQQVKGLGGGWQDIRQHPRGQGYTTLPERIVAERRANGPYRSLRELLARARMSREQAETLIRAGALEEFGLPRRELLWQLGLLTEAAVAKSDAARENQLALPLPTEQDMAELPALSAWQELAWDHDRLGLSPGRHPMALVRPLLHEGLITSRHLGGVGNPNRLPQGMIVEMAGMVVTRQRPQTASGVMFMLLEDEFGLANLVVYTALQERQRELVRGTPFVIVRGRVDNEQSGFPNIIAEHFRPCPLPGFIETPVSHDFG